MERERSFKMFMVYFFILNVKGAEKNNSLIYILIWSTPHIFPFSFLELGQNYFTNKKCKFQNCFVTTDKSYFNDIKEFDVVLFNVMNMNGTYDDPRPLVRSEKQKYVFMSVESPVSFPIPKIYDGFFNLTWTYKLDSDGTMRYLVIRNKRGKIIGPKINMHWMNINDMKQTSKYIKRKLQSKNIAVAWFASHCETKGHRESLYWQLRDELAKHNLKIDIFGACGHKNCHVTSECDALLESDYYFYLAFENTVCEDYVTEKLLRALQNFVVPVVYGGANYTRFMPNGMYLNGKVLGPQKLARIMNDAVRNKEKYYEFFKWHRYYSFHEPNENADSDEVCAFCAILNDKNKTGETSVYKHITNFWQVDDTQNN